MESFERLLVFGLAVWRFSVMATREEGPFEIFSRCRELVGAEAEGSPVFWDNLNTAGKLLQCPYCLSVWLGIVLWATYKLNKQVYSFIAMSLFGSAVTALVEDYYASNVDT